MKPILQTQLYGENAMGNGNCVAAAMASVLELPLWMVPPWEQMFGRDDWQKRRREWLAQVLGLEVVTLYASRRKPGQFTPEYWEEDGKDYAYFEVVDLPEFYIACGKTVRGSHHATVYSAGALVHDPHYSGDGLIAVDRIEFFRALPDAQRVAAPATALAA